MEELTPSKEMETVIKSAVLLRYLINPIHAGLFGSKFSGGGGADLPPPTNNRR